MKAVWIFYDIVLDTTILALLKEASSGGYNLHGAFAAVNSVAAAST